MMVFSDNAHVRYLHHMTEQFLKHQVPEFLGKLVDPQAVINANEEAPKFKLANVEFIEHNHNGASYLIQMKESALQFKIWIGLNVRFAQVIYFVPIRGKIPKDSEDACAHLERKFRMCFSISENIGYNVNFNYAKVDDEELISIWAILESKSTILANPQEKLFLLQDITMMTQSFVNTAHRESIDITGKAFPHPL